jgi:molybdopterin/thiamine biosynthesis adenylyltransferase
MNVKNWHENPAYKNLYDSEINLLQNGLGGDFELIRLLLADDDKRIKAIGWLKYDEVKKQPVKIIFPAKYPFQQASITPLGIDQMGNVLTTSVAFGKGNQYVDGVMCLMRKDQWNRYEHNIGWLLRRSQKWLLRASSPEGFPKNEIVEETPALLNHIGQIIMGSSFKIPGNATTGNFTLTQFKPNHYIVEENILPANPFSLKINKEIFKWFAFPAGVTSTALFKGDIVQVIINSLQKYFAFDPGQLLAQPNLAFYFPDDPNPWHFFKMILQPDQPGGIIPLYYITRIVDRELYHRTKDVFDDQILKTKKVTIIGLGALGSETARSLARNAVGHFNLFDYDSFEMGNSVRHAGDLYYIGEQKVAVVKQLILRSNPNITVNAYPIDILNDTGMLTEAISKSDLCIVLTAEDNVDYMINELYVPELNIPFIFARLSAGAVSGSVQVVQHKRTACLRCLSLHEADTLPVTNQKRNFAELSPEYGNCSTPAVPGSEIDTKEIALQVSRMALQLLLGKTTRYAKRLGDQFYWHGPFGSTDFPPFTWETKAIKIHPDCECCN